MNKTAEAMVLSYYDNPNELNQKIKELISEGWQLQGGVSVCEADRQGGGRTLIYAQAMVKKSHCQSLDCFTCYGGVDGQELTECDRISFSSKQPNCSPEVESDTIPSINDF